MSEERNELIKAVGKWVKENETESTFSCEEVLSGAVPLSWLLLKAVALLVEEE